MKNTILLAASSLLLITSCTKTKGTISQTYNKGTAKYLNITNVRNEPLVKPNQAIDKTGKVFFGEKVLLVGEKDKGIHVYDNTNNRSPVKSIFINLPFSNEFYVDGDILYVETHYDLVKIDISNPVAPILVHRKEFAFGDPIRNDQGQVLIGFDYKVVTETFELNSPEASQLAKSNQLFFDYNNQLIPESDVPSSFVGSQGKSKGTLNKIAVANNHIYLVGNTELHTFADNGTTIQSISKQEIGWDIETIYSEGDNLFIGTRSSMIVMDASNPSAPNKISEYTHVNACDPVYPNGDVAYLTLRTSSESGCAGTTNVLEVIDITNLNAPNKINEVALSSPFGMGVLDNYLFVGEGTNGISILDITSPANPSLVAQNNSIKTFDVIAHPTLTNVILVIEEFGFKQYQFDPTNLSLQELSSVTLP
jgi:hypothetical protein